VRLAYVGEGGVDALHDLCGLGGLADCGADEREFLANLGLDPTPLDDQLNDEFYIPISAERLDMLDAFDTVLWQTATTPEVKDTIQ